MGIRVTCPNCNKQLNVKSFLAGKRGVCPGCQTKFDIPAGTANNVVLEVDDGDGAVSVPIVEPVAPPIQTPLPVAAPLVPPFAAAPIMAAPAVVAAPQVAWHVSSATGERYGPLADETLRQWVYEHRLLPDWLVWREGWPEWQRADAVFPELVPVLPPSVVSAPAAIPVGPLDAPPVVYPEEAPDTFQPFPQEPPRRFSRRPAGRRSNKTPMIMVILLLLGVLVLAPLLGYVLFKHS